MKQSKIIGVTGITGSGTSTVSSILMEMGGYVISADKIAHEVMRKGEPAYNKIISVFGPPPQPDNPHTPSPALLHPDGEINRKTLGSLVFGNPEKLAVLESIIHPAVITQIESQLTNATSYPFAVIDAPLLIESGLHKICHSVWLVTAPDETRIARIIARDSIDSETAIRRLQSRKGDAFLLPHANFVIENNSDVKSLRIKIEDNPDIKTLRDKYNSDKATLRKIIDNQI